MKEPAEVQASRTAEAELLRREEDLSREALAAPGLSGEQRRIHTRHLEDVRRRRDAAARARQAGEHGWMPFQPSADWIAGFVEDPRPLRGQANTVALAGAALAASGAAWASWRGSAEWLATIAAFVIVFLAAFATLRQLTGSWVQRGERKRAAYLDIYFPRDEASALRVFNAPMPARAASAYRQAKTSRLFDEVLVCSPREEDFRRVEETAAPNLGLLDPILLGVIGGQAFLIARWDLAADLGLA